MNKFNNVDDLELINAMNEVMNFSETKYRFYKEEGYSFAEEQALWETKKELSDDMLQRYFSTVIEDVDNVRKVNTDPHNEFMFETYFDEGDDVDFVSYRGDDNKMYLPIFSNFNAIFKWMTPKENSHLPDMDIKIAFDMVMTDDAYAGILINPCSTHWIIRREDILNYMK
jgi:hypothetical protein